MPLPCAGLPAAVLPLLRPVAFRADAAQPAAPAPPGAQQLRMQAPFWWPQHSYIHCRLLPIVTTGKGNAASGPKLIGCCTRRARCCSCRARQCCRSNTVASVASPPQRPPPPSCPPQQQPPAPQHMQAPAAAAVPGVHAPLATHLAQGAHARALQPGAQPAAHTHPAEAAPAQLQVRAALRAHRDQRGPGAICSAALLAAAAGRRTPPERQRRHQVTLPPSDAGGDLHLNVYSCLDSMLRPAMLLTLDVPL